MEMLQGINETAFSKETIYAVLVGIKEAIEMIAIVLLIGALISHLAPMLRKVSVEIQPLERW